MTIENISVLRLALAMIPVALVILLLWRWKLNSGQAVYAVARMLIQLALIGYALVFIFETDNSAVVLSVLAVMVIAAGWIALNPINGPRAPLFLASLGSIVIGGGATLALITAGVLELEPWYKPSYMIPLAGMIFANSMTSNSLAIERLMAELRQDGDFIRARGVAYRASLIPTINTLFAVGLVALPGMMTGQILSGVSPLVAARYQIMVMCMIFGAAGISTAIFILLARRTLESAATASSSPAT